MKYVNVYTLQVYLTVKTIDFLSNESHLVFEIIIIIQFILVVLTFRTA